MNQNYTFTKPMNLSFKTEDGTLMFFAITNKKVTMNQKTKETSLKKENIDMENRNEVFFVESHIEVLYDGEIRLFLEDVNEECIFGKPIKIYCNSDDDEKIEDIIIGELMKLNNDYAIMKDYSIR